MAGRTCRNHNEPGQPTDRRMRLVTARARATKPARRDWRLIMKRTMATVIVGPTIGAPVSIFASERESCGTAGKATSDDGKARLAEQRYQARAVKAEQQALETSGVPS